MIDRRRKIVVVRVKALDAKKNLEPSAKASIADRSPHNSDKAVAASAGLNVLAAEVINRAQTTVHVAEVPDKLSSSFCPS